MALNWVVFQSYMWCDTWNDSWILKLNGETCLMWKCAWYDSQISINIDLDEWSD